MKTIKSRSLSPAEIKISLITLTMLLTLFTTISVAQPAEDKTDGRFHDDLLNNLVGKWDVATVAHGQKFSVNLEAKWVMSHQYLNIHYKSQEVIPWLKMPFEGEFFFGYNHPYKRYTVHEMTVFGGNGPYEGFCYAYKTGNEFKLIKNWAGSDTVTINRFIWEPVSKSWTMDMRLMVGGKEGNAFVEMKLEAVRPSSN